MKKYFEISVNKYVQDSFFKIYRPASLNIPKNNAVMFVTKDFIGYADRLLKCKDCLVFWPKSVFLPDNIAKLHAVCRVENPHKEYCRFYSDNNITYLPEITDYNMQNGAFIAEKSVIGKNCHIFPGSYIGPEVEIGNNVYIGSGAKLIGEVHIGNNVIIRENAVIGSDGLSTDRDERGKALTMPQFGGVIIEDDVQIGALTVVARGAIDNTIIKKGSKIDNSCFISHNVQIGEDTFIVGETIMFGSSSTGNQSYISGNATIRDSRHIGNKAKVAMGAVVVKDVDNNTVVKGNPAK